MTCPRELRVAFGLELPPGYRASEVLAYHGRDPLSLVERVASGRLRKALDFGGLGGVLEVDLEEGRARCTYRGARPPGEGELPRVTRRLLGLELDPAPFEAWALGPASPRGLGALVALRRGLRIPLTPDVWECLVWAILGQQVNLAFAYALRRELVAACGEALPGGLWRHPGARDLATLEPEDLKGVRLSGAKARCLLGAARAVAEGELPLEELGGLDPQEAACRLMALKGVGPWTAQYVLMRGCGFPDCVPVGDAALTLALQRFHGLETRPGPRETLELLAPMAPHRSLAVFHLWASLKGVPA